MTNQAQPVNLQSMLYGLERRWLDEGHVPSPLNLGSLLDQTSFLRVLGIASFWKGRNASSYDQRMDDIVTSLHGQGLGLLFLVLGHGHRSGVYLGIQGSLQFPERELLLRTMLTSAFPGIRLADRSETQLGQFLRQNKFFHYQGLMSGIPTRKAFEARLPMGAPKGVHRQPQSYPSTDVPMSQIERLIRGLKGTETKWGFLVYATPIALSEVLAEASQRFMEVAMVAKDSKRQFQQVTQIMVQRTPTAQEGTTLSESGEIVNREAEYVIELLEQQLERLNEARAVGMWQSTVSIFAAEQSVVQRAGALLRAIFAGIRSRPDPIRIAMCRPGGLNASEYTTSLTSIELSTLTQLPTEEFPGYQITDFATFDLDLTSRPDPPTVDLGTIDNQGVDTGLVYEIARDDFAKHGMITGVTGSGKTTTIFAILDSLWNQSKGGIPFLVIEPAKAEYRSLRGREANGPIPDLVVYTLGDETVVPFRLNPFEFEIFDADHFVHVQTHIDYLKSVFNAAFILYAPMPYVLEICLHEIYQDYGWDLTTSRNRRIPERAWDKVTNYPVFPTLADLAAKIDSVTERLGYDERIKMDVQAGLKARIGSLLLGGKGRMLNTRSSIPIRDLLSRPTVLELERIGNDDEKAFLMGLILTRVYEYRRVQAAQASGALPFQHLIVVEEAHRLLQNISTHVDTEAMNVKGHAVETFTNMLAEIRAYGQGMLIAEQIPSKLAPDAIKNTNLKIVHRLIAEDDRRVLGGATNMDEDQIRYLITLPPGRAAVYSEGADHPYLVRMRDYTSVRTKERPTDRHLAAALIRERQRPCFEPARDYYRYLSSAQPLFNRVMIEDYAHAILQHSEFAERWDGWLQISLEHPYLSKKWFTNLRELASRVLDGITVALDDALMGALLKAAEDNLITRGRLYGWSYELIEQIRSILVAAIDALVSGQDQQAEQHLRRFSAVYRQATSRSYGPFAGCVYCQQRCLYRPEAARSIRYDTFRQEWRSALRLESQTDRLNELANLIRYSAEQVVSPLDPQLTAALALCIGVQMAAAERYSRSTQRFVSNEMSKRLSVTTVKNNDEKQRE